MSIFSKTITLSLLLSLLLFSGCKTKPDPIPPQTLTSGINPHPGWVDSKGYYKGTKATTTSDNVSPYGKGGTLGDPSWANENTDIIPFNQETVLETRETTIVIDESKELDNVLPPIYFGFDQAAVSSSERKKIDQAAEYLKANPSYRLRIEGNCDWRGTSQYNLALGDRRASSIKDYLQLLEIEPSRIDVLSNGDQFAVTNGTEDEMGKDRRADLVIISD